MSEREVDIAMAATRPEKATMRQLWVDEVVTSDANFREFDAPTYLTLPGAAGFEIQMLIDVGVLSVTETGAISEPEEMRVVAVESSPDAVLELQTRFNGLKILEQPIQDLLHSIGDLTWPDKVLRRHLRAHVVNLDLNQPLKSGGAEGAFTFPVLQLVKKFARLHEIDPTIDWTLCLTLHGALELTQEDEKRACRFVAENFANHADFAADAKAHLGDDLYARIVDAPDDVRLCRLPELEQQLVMMVLVPKKIAHDAHAMGWRTRSVRNLRYGGTEERAPMVTWITRFEWDERAGSEPTSIYADSLSEAMSGNGAIGADGTIA